MELLKVAKKLIGKEVAISLKHGQEVYDVIGILNKVEDDGVLVLKCTYNETYIRDSEIFLHLNSVNVIFKLNRA